MPSESERTAEPNRKPAILHDLRHSLFALRTGIDLLPQIHEDIENFNEVQRVLQNEVRKASVLLKQLVEHQNEVVVTDRTYPAD